MEQLEQQRTVVTEEFLRKKIGELEGSFEFKRMRSRAFENLIEIAKREEGISILKKMVSGSDGAVRDAIS